MKRISQLFMLIACLCALICKLNAQTKSNSTKTGDPRVVKALTQTKSEYEVAKDGIFKVTYQTTGKRTQSAFIGSDTQNVFGMEMRLVISFAQVNGNIPSPVAAYLMLEENLKSFPNTWAVEKDNTGNFTISNLVYVPAECDGETLDKALSSVMIAADKMEESLSKEDKL